MYSIKVPRFNKRAWWNKFIEKEQQDIEALAQIVRIVAKKTL